jgi:hypothetical protein
MKSSNCILMGVIVVVTCLFILALYDVMPKPERLTLVPKGASDSDTKSTFYSSRSHPALILPRRPYDEEMEQQNQVDEDINVVKLATNDVEDFQTEPYDPARMSLERSVFDSHRAFVNDSYVSTQGANSTDSVRTDEQNINPRVGLRKVDYTSAFSESDARVVSSETPDQINQVTGQFVI